MLFPLLSMLQGLELAQHVELHPVCDCYSLVHANKLKCAIDSASSHATHRSDAAYHAGCVHAPLNGGRGSQRQLTSIPLTLRKCTANTQQASPTWLPGLDTAWI